MIFTREILGIVAKRIAMLATDKVAQIAQSITGSADYPVLVTGSVLGLMPHFAEKAILTSSHVPADIAVGLCSRVVNEFETVTKMVTNAGGFTNPFKKAIFNASFHTMFRREYEELRPKIETVWETARLDHTNPIDYLAYAALKLVESELGYTVENEQRIAATTAAITSLFTEVHSILNGA